MGELLTLINGLNKLTPQRCSTYFPNGLQPHNGKYDNNRVLLI